MVFDNDKIKYGIILGIIFLSKAGIKLNYSEGGMEWLDYSISLCLPWGLDSNDSDIMKDRFFIQSEDKLFREDWLDYYARKILNTKYE